MGRHSRTEISRISRISSAALGSGALAALLCLLSSGCASQSLAKHVAAVSAATAPVVDQATEAYEAANAIHDLSENYDAVSEFDKTEPVYNPRKVAPLLSQAQLDARLAVLKALQVYVQTLTAVTNGTESPELDAAAKSLGCSLAGLVNAGAPAVESGLGIVVAPETTTQTTVTTTGSTTSSTTTTSSTPPPVISPQMSNVLSTGINALEEFLASKKVKAELPGVVEKMDPQVKALCELLAQEIDILSSQETIDFNSVINRETLFIRTATLSAEERRQEIMKLPDMGRQEQAAAHQLAQLKSALVKLELTHHALAADAQGNNPESLKSKLGELEAAGNNLGKFYSTLSTPAAK
jgi:hypothetical protein